MTYLLTHAHQYANTGIRVIPITPGRKHPPIPAWQHAATTNHQQIDDWWHNQYTGHGIGLALGTWDGDGYLIALDIDNHNGDGHAELRQLETRHQPLPDTWTAITGSGGTHHIFRTPTPINNQQGKGNRLAPNIDIRGQGGQIVAAPTIHPTTHHPYQWETGHAPWDIPIADAPQWLLNLLTPPTPTPPTHTPTPTGSSPADRLRNTWNWPEELTRQGWTHTRTTGTDTYWTRPGKDPREGHSAILHNNGPLVIFTTDIPTHIQQLAQPTRDGSGLTITPFDWYTAHNHNGNRSEASRALNQHNPPTPTPGDTPEPDLADEHIDNLAHIVNWTQFWNNDHNDEAWIAWPLIPQGRTISLYAPAKAGKSTILLAVIAAACTGQQPLDNRETRQTPVDILYLDYEISEADLQERLQQLGYGPHSDLTHLHYALLPSLPALDTPEGGQYLLNLATRLQVDAVVVDTIGRAVEGEENSADTIRAFYRHTAQRLKQAGIAVLRTDHLGKDADKGQRGTLAKNDDVDIVYRLTRIQDGVKLNRTHSRITWAPDNLAIAYTETDEGTVDIRLAATARFPDGTAPIAAIMDDLDIPIDQPNRDTFKQMRAAGHKYRTLAMAQAVRMRREQHLRNDPFGTGKPVDKLVDNSIGDRESRRESQISDTDGNHAGIAGNHNGINGIADSRRRGNHSVTQGVTEDSQPQPDDDPDSLSEAHPSHQPSPTIIPHMDRATGPGTECDNCGEHHNQRKCPRCGWRNN